MMPNSAIVVIVLHFSLIIASKQNCIFVPNDNIECVQYFEFSGGTVGCIRFQDSLVATGLYQRKDGNVWISVQLEGRRTLYIERKDGICVDNCCDAFKKSEKRFLLFTVNPCYPNPCIHGHCQEIISAYWCTCYIGWYGTNCEKAIPLATTTETTSTIHPSTIPSSASSHTHSTDPCRDNSLVNCADQNVCSSNLKQLCPLLCSLCFDHCMGVTCQNSGSCSSSDGGYRCNCRLGFTGRHCEHAPDFCLSNPCAFGTCTTSSLSYTCTCQQGYTGTNCQTAIDSSFPKCDRLGVINSLAMKTSVTASGEKGCLDGTHSSDALIIKFCRAPLMSVWKLGPQLSGDCSQVSTYAPIVRSRNNQLTNIAGIIVSCDNGIIWIVQQTCGSPIELKNITNSAAASYNIIVW